MLSSDKIPLAYFELMPLKTGVSHNTYKRLAGSTK